MRKRMIGLFSMATRVIAVAAACVPGSAALSGDLPIAQPLRFGFSLVFDFEQFARMGTISQLRSVAKVRMRASRTLTQDAKDWTPRLDLRIRRRAVIAVARKLAVILHRMGMWVDGSEFRWGAQEPVAVKTRPSQLKRCADS